MAPNSNINQCVTRLVIPNQGLQVIDMEDRFDKNRASDQVSPKILYNILKKMNIHLTKKVAGDGTS